MKTLTRGGETIAYACAGEGPRTVALAHNLMCDHEVFGAVTTALARTFRVVALDVRGHGASTAHAPYAIADAAADLSAILAAEGAREVVVVGLSVGASMAIEMLLPGQRRDARVLGAVLLSPCGAAATRGERVRDTLLAQAMRGVGLPGELAAQIARSLFGETFQTRAPEVVRARAAKIQALVPRFAAHALAAWSKRRDVLSELRAVGVPVTVVVGEEDARCPPADGEAVRAAIPGASLVRLPQTGHVASEEQPDEVARAIAALCRRAFPE